MILAAAAGLGSCSAVRHCKAPEVDFPAAIAGGAAADSLAIADMEWWQFYGDSTLCNIIRHTLANNKDMLAAAARVERMRQLYRIGKADRLPSVSGTAYADHETNDYAGEEPSRDPEFGAKATVSWELDLWGNLRWAKRKGGAEYLASVEDRRAMQMTLVAEVAAAYFRLMALDNELSIVRRTLITRSEGAYQAQLRFEGGLTSETVFQQAKVEYASTAALIPDLERKIEVMENSISLLMGENPDWRVVRSKMNTEAEFAESLPVGLPSELLLRRPDVRASEQQLRAAMAAAGMAYADRFPRIVFNLTGGWENDDVSGFFRSPFSYVAGTLASPIFGFGRKQARYKAALAAYDEARLGYEQKVLTVFKEANDAVVSYRSVRRTAALKVNLRDAARKYVELAQLQYRGGSINYIDVLDAQRRYFDAQIGVSNAVRDEHLALVDLYKALGGGWSIEPQAQLTYHYLWGDDYTTRNGAKVNQDNADSLVGRLGFIVSREFNAGTDHAGRVYLKASILHDFLGDTTSTIVDDIHYRDDDDLGDTWYIAGIGTDINLGKNTRFYFDAERNFNADVKMKYRFNAGLRFGF